MATILRHGGEAHVVRPDRVYRTGVLTSIVGYQPQADVQAVAASFTLGPPSGTQLSGLRGPTTRLGAWFENVKANLKAQFGRAQVAVAVVPAAGPPAPQAPGPTSAAAASALAPDQAGRAMAVFNLVQGNPAQGGNFVARAARVAAFRRDNSYYRAG